MIIEKTTWQEFKNILDSKKLLIQYEDTESFYYLYAVDDSIVYTYRLKKNTEEAIDFEQNYKSSANKCISNESLSYAERTTNISITQQVVGQVNRKIKIIDEIVPLDKTWYITGWSCSSQAKSFFELYEYDPSAEVHTTLDSMESVSDWVKTNKILSLETDSDKVEGNYSLKVILKFSDRGLQLNEYIERTFETNQDWSEFDEISLWVKSSEDNVKIALQLFQGSNNYLFNSIPITKDWKKISFDLSEITSFDRTAISKIRVRFYETIDLRKDVTVWVDWLEGYTYGNFKLLDSVFVGSYIPFVKTFNAALKINSNKRIKVYGIPYSVGNMIANLNIKEI